MKGEGEVLLDLRNEGGVEDVKRSLCGFRAFPDLEIGVFLSFRSSRLSSLRSPISIGSSPASCPLDLDVCSLDPLSMTLGQWLKFDQSLGNTCVMSGMWVLRTGLRLTVARTRELDGSMG